MNLDASAVGRGLVAALAWVVPAAAANALAAAADAGALILLSFLAITLGFAFGGYSAARAAPTLPLHHAAAAAAAAFAAVQGVLVVVALVRGRAVSPVAIAFAALLAACAGALGGLLATRSPRPREL